jgi:hypothetical protein
LDVKFCYCPECKTLHPRNWYSREKCEVCNSECTTIEVKRSIYGLSTYLVSIVAMILMLLYVGHFQMEVSVFDFMSSLPSDVVVAGIFGSIGLAFALQYMDLRRASNEAERIVRNMEGRN